jgi:hypothetical protein
MRTALLLLAFGGFVAAMMSATLMMIAIQFVPYVVLGAVIATVIRRGRQSSVAAPRKHLPTRSSGHEHLASPGWAYVPVWVGSTARPDLPVIDAEVVEDLTQ